MERTNCEDLIINCAGRRFDSIEGLFRDMAGRVPVPCRPQIGSYTCGNYFLALLQRMAGKPVPYWEEGYDLVIPILSEGQLETFLPHLEDPAVRNARAVVVNDFGMLRLFHDRPGIRLGRLMFRDYRDHRYPAHEEDRCSKSGTLVDSLQELGYAFTAVESELFSENVEESVNAPVYYHVPYRQVSYNIVAV